MFRTGDGPREKRNETKTLIDTKSIVRAKTDFEQASKSGMFVFIFKRILVLPLVVTLKAFDEEINKKSLAIFWAQNELSKPATIKTYLV